MTSDRQLNLIFPVLIQAVERKWERMKTLLISATEEYHRTTDTLDLDDIKHKLLSNYLIQQLKRPDIHMCLV